MYWLPPAIYRSTCAIEITYFPFDYQNCTLAFRCGTIPSFLNIGTIYNCRFISLCYFVHSSSYDGLLWWFKGKTPAHRTGVTSRLPLFSVLIHPHCHDLQIPDIQCQWGWPHLGCWRDRGDYRVGGHRSGGFHRYSSSAIIKLQYSNTQFIYSFHCSHPSENGEWAIVHRPGRKMINKRYSPDDLEYQEILFNLIIQRKPLFYVINIILPCSLISSLVVLAYFLPAQGLQ